MVDLPSTYELEGSSCGRYVGGSNVIHNHQSYNKYLHLRQYWLPCHQEAIVTPYSVIVQTARVSRIPKSSYLVSLNISVIYSGSSHSFIQIRELLCVKH